MISVEVELTGSRRATVHFSRLEDVSKAEILAKESYWDDEDQSRAVDLERILRAPGARALTFTTTGHPDVLQVFLTDSHEPDERVFACTLVTRTRLRDLVSHAPVIEGFATQVLASEHLSTESVRTGIEAWAERTFPNLGQVAIGVEHWTSTNGFSVDLLRILLSQSKESSASAETADVEISPDPRLADPPYDEDMAA